MDQNSAVPRYNGAFRFLRRSKFWKTFLAILVGGTGGYLYYHFVGCSSGACPLTSNPYLSVVWGSLFGLFAVSTTN